MSDTLIDHANENLAYISAHWPRFVEWYRHDLRDALEKYASLTPTDYPYQLELNPPDGGPPIWIHANLDDVDYVMVTHSKGELGDGEGYIIETDEHDDASFSLIWSRFVRIETVMAALEALDAQKDEIGLFDPLTRQRRALTPRKIEGVVIKYPTAEIFTPIWTRLHVNIKTLLSDEQLLEGFEQPSGLIVLYNDDVRAIVSARQGEDIRREMRHQIMRERGFVPLFIRAMGVSSARALELEVERRLRETEGLPSYDPDYQG